MMSKTMKTKKQPMALGNVSGGDKPNDYSLKSEWEVKNVVVSNAGYFFGKSRSRREKEKQW